MISGLIIIVFAGMLQELFILPLTYTRNWKWKRYWLAFPFFGMIMLNWLIGLILFPQAPAMPSTRPSPSQRRKDGPCPKPSVLPMQQGLYRSLGLTRSGPFIDRSQVEQLMTTQPHSITKNNLSV